MRILLRPLLLMLLLTLGTAAPAAAQDLSSLTIETAGGERRFAVELADDAASRRRGLMFRQSMPLDHGMLFDFKRDIYISMWMRNTFIPLDMLFLDKSGRVTFIRENATPGSLDTIQPPDRNRAVLELRGGTVARLGIATGDQVEHKIFR